MLRRRKLLMGRLSADSDNRGHGGMRRRGWETGDKELNARKDWRFEQKK